MVETLSVNLWLGPLTSPLGCGVKGLGLGQRHIPMSLLSPYERAFRLDNSPCPSGPSWHTQVPACSAGPWELGDLTETCRPAHPTQTFLLWVVAVSPLLSDFLNPSGSVTPILPGVGQNRLHCPWTHVHFNALHFPSSLLPVIMDLIQPWAPSLALTLNILPN